MKQDDINQLLCMTYFRRLWLQYSTLIIYSNTNDEINHIVQETVGQIDIPRSSEAVQGLPLNHPQILDSQSDGMDW